MISRNDWSWREIREALMKSYAINLTAAAAARAKRVGYAEAVKLIVRYKATTHSGSRAPRVGVKAEKAEWKDLKLDGN